MVMHGRMAMARGRCERERGSFCHDICLSVLAMLVHLTFVANIKCTIYYFILSCTHSSTSRKILQISEPQGSFWLTVKVHIVSSK